MGHDLIQHVGIHKYNLVLNKQGLTACHCLACPYNLNVLISPQNANQPSMFLICSFHSSFLLPPPVSSSDHCFPSELYQQLSAFQPISKGKHNNNQSLGLMHSTSSAVNTNWFLKALSFRRALLALVFVEKRGPPLKWQAVPKTQLVWEGDKG